MFTFKLFGVFRLSLNTGLDPKTTNSWSIPSKLNPSNEGFCLLVEFGVDFLKGNLEKLMLEEDSPMLFSMSVTLFANYFTTLF